MRPTQPTDVLHFCFEALTDKQHLTKEVARDEATHTRVGSTLEAAARCDLLAWRATPEGRLAEIIVLDQFSRNLYRDTARAFAQDALALVLAQELMASAQDRSLPVAHLRLHALHAQRVGAGTCAGRGPVFAAGHGGQPALRGAPQRNY